MNFFVDNSILLNKVALADGNLLLQVVILAVVVYGCAHFMSGIELKGIISALIVAVVVALLNVTLGNILDFASFGVYFIELAVDVIILMIADYFLAGFRIKNFLWAIAMAFVISIADGIIGLKLW